jgi:uncharacterized membrane protein
VFLKGQPVARAEGGAGIGRSPRLQPASQLIPVTRRIYGANVSAIITQKAEGYDNGIRAYHFALGAITWIASPYFF